MAKVIKLRQESFLDDLICPSPVVEMKCLSIGAVLKKARQKNPKISIEDIAREICARPQHIKAIEEDQFDLLPAPSYAIGFIRAYATYLGLDAGSLVQRFRTEIVPEQAVTRLVFLESIDGPHMPKWAMAATILVLIAGSYVTWLGTTLEGNAPARAAQGGLAPKDSVQASTLSGERDYAVKSGPALSTSEAVSPASSLAPQQLQPVPTSTATPSPARVIPLGQKSVDAAVPAEHDLFNKARIAAVDLGPAQNNPLMLTVGNPGTLDFSLNGIEAGGEARARPQGPIDLQY